MTQADCHSKGHERAANPKDRHLRNRHAKLHDIDLKAPKDMQKQLDSRTREVEAEAQKEQEAYGGYEFL